jgi:hypothetical protein
MQIHEIAAAFIVGGFIIMNKPNVTTGDWWRGLLIIMLATIGAIG